jgi:Rrf2 family protein
VQILLQLKGAGLVASTRGAAGGYRLSKPPEQITLGAVMAVIDGQDEITSSAGVASPHTEALMAEWKEIATSQREMLEGVTLADLVDRAHQLDEPMYYI